MDSEDAIAPDRARLQAALLLWHLGEASEAKRQVSQLLSMQPHLVPALTLLGWPEQHGKSTFQLMASPPHPKYRARLWTHGYERIH